MRVPLLDLNEQLKPLRDEIVERVIEVIDSTGYILGDKVTLFEKAVAGYCQTRHAIGVTSGTDALLAVLMALGIGPGDRVLTTPYTFIATVGCILRLGAVPVFADIDPRSFNIDPDEVERIVEESSKAEKIKLILPVHLYGQCAQMDRILEVSRKHDIPVVEDAAQAIGAAFPMATDGEVNWLRAGSMGDAGCFSFFPSKNLGGIGDGGMITLQDDQLAALIQRIRVHGGEPKYYHDVIGGNFRLDPIQAVALSVKLPHLPSWHAGRRKNATLYGQLFAEAGLVDSGAVQPPVEMFAQQAGCEKSLPDHHIYNQFVVRVRKRDQLRAFLQENQIGVEIYYPVPMHKQGCVTRLVKDLPEFPEAERASSETLALPIYPELTSEMQHFVVDKISEFYKKIL